MIRERFKFKSCHNDPFKRGFVGLLILLLYLHTIWVCFSHNYGTFDINVLGHLMLVNVIYMYYYSYVTNSRTHAHKSDVKFNTAKVVSKHWSLNDFNEINKNKRNSAAWNNAHCLVSCYFFCGPSWVYYTSNYIIFSNS